MGLRILVAAFLVFNSGYTMENISHFPRSSSFEESFHGLRGKICNRGDLLYTSVERQLEILSELSQFELGRFLIERGGLNGFWTHYVVSHPEKPKKLSSLLETFLLERAPTCLATQERFVIFKREIQKEISEGCIFASIPSGLMGEFLDLDFSLLSSFSLQAIDLDLETLSQAKNYAKMKGLEKFCTFTQKDAWNLNSRDYFDLIASNGLTIYEQSDEKVLQLFQEFYKSLKSKGTLITSFLTPPPIGDKKTEWEMSHIDSQDALLQKVIFADILGAKWQVFRSERTVRELLKKAGFQSVEILYDKAHIFPTIIARKNE